MTTYTITLVMSDISPAIYFSLFGILPVAFMIYYLRLAPDQRGTLVSFMNPADRDQGPMLRRALLRGRPKEETDEQRATRIAEEERARAIENKRAEQEAEEDEKKRQAEDRADYMNNGPLREEDDEQYKGGKQRIKEKEKEKEKEKKTKTKGRGRGRRSSKKHRKQSRKQHQG